MIYDVDLPEGSDGKPKHGWRVYDATGKRIVLTHYVNTETGEVRRIEVKDGQVQIGPNHRVRVITEFHPAPLLVVPINPGEAYILPTDNVDPRMLPYCPSI